MDQCFRIALWMFLIVYLQANPIPTSPPFDLEDLGIELLEDITCEDNVTFTSPTNVDEEKCHNATLTHFMEQLTHAIELRNLSRCEDVDERIEQTLTAFKDGPQFNNSAKCELKTKKSEFKKFVNDLKNFLQRINDGN